MARACRFQFHPGRFRTVFPVLLLIASASGTANARTKPEHLYLLAGTANMYGATGYPVRLYKVSSGRLALVRRVSRSLFSVTDDLNGHLYVLDQNRRRLMVIHENAPEKLDVVPAPPGRGPGQGFDFYWMTWGAIAGPGVPPGIVYAGGNSPTTWRVTRVLGDAIPGRPRIERGNWGLYRYLKYAGPGGGPSYENALSPGGTINHGQILMPYTLGGPGHGDLGPTPPFLPRKAGTAAGYPGRPRGATIVADTARFFAFTAPLPSTANQSSGTIYLLNRPAERWSVINFPLCSLWPRLFGAWLACNVSKIVKATRHIPGVPHAEVDNFITPQGRLLLRNLVDGRKLTINTGQEDSEMLDVRKNGLVLYRVNNEIFSARIEGDKLSAPKLVVKGEDVPEVHWVFWSRAEAEPHASASDIQTLFAQLRSRATSSEALKQLTKLGGEDSAARKYVSEHLPNLIETSGGEVKTNAIQLAGDLKIKSAVPMLVPLLRYFSMVGVTDFGVTARLQNDPVANALVQIGGPSVGPVTHVLERGNRQARWRAARILFNISSPAAIHALRSHIPKEKDPHLKQFIARHLGR